MRQQISISVDNLKKRYRKAEELSLDNVSFSVKKGEKFGVLGPNGAGKTTLISIICGIIPATSGGFHYFDEDHELSTHDVKRTIGFVPQDYAFYDELTPTQNMMYFGAFYKLPKHVIEERTSEIFAVLGLKKVADKKVSIFSGGLKRRLNLAIGILHKPKVLFLDEPTVGADVQSKHAMIEYLNKLNKEGTTVVYTSHHMQEAEMFCDRIAFIDRGKLIACDSMSKLKEDHQSEDLHSLFINLTGEGYFDGHE